MTVSENDFDKRLTEVESAHASVVAIGIVLGVIGWVGLIWMVFNTVPTVQYRWVGFMLLHLAVTGSVMPFVRYLNVRFAEREGVYIKTGVIIRQAMWCGLLAATSFWLAIPRLFSFGLLIVLTITVIVIEVLLRIRETTGYRGE